METTFLYRSVNPTHTFNGPQPSILSPTAASHLSDAACRTLEKPFVSTDTCHLQENTARKNVEAQIVVSTSTFFSAPVVEPAANGRKKAPPHDKELSYLSTKTKTQKNLATHATHAPETSLLVGCRKK